MAEDEENIMRNEDNTSSDFWVSKTCQVIGILCLVGLVVGAIVMFICMGGHCSSDACNMDCDSGAWGYDSGLGAECWGKCYEICDGSSQSPINFDTSYTNYVNLSSLIMTGYDQNTSMAMLNNGHTVDIIFNPGITIQGLGLPEVYEAYQFHFHWGSGSNSGSEHTINQRQYPLEMHIVHYNTKYDSNDEAMTEPEGLAVMGIMFVEGPEDNPNFDIITENLENVKYKNNYVELGEQYLGDFLPSRLDRYFRYDGSLTTPPCYESVVWTVWLDPVVISENQLNKFREILTDESEDSPKMVNNYRPVMPMGNRQVYFGRNY